jgi:hypothetical protein
VARRGGVALAGTARRLARRPPVLTIKKDDSDLTVTSGK